MSLLSVCRPCRQQLFQRALSIRSLSTQDSTSSDPAAAPPAYIPTTRPPGVPPAYLSPTKAHTPKQEHQLQSKYGIRPIGSRRRRAAMANSQQIPLEQLPYQCFQEALKFLHEDRVEKIAGIETQSARIQKLKDQQPDTEEAARQKHVRLMSMRRRLEWLKIQADINDPLVKQRFEDGKGDMNRPIYRFLARRKWEARKKLVIEQRISQMHVVPDLLPSIDITADVDLQYPGRTEADGKSVVPRYGSNRNRPRVKVMPGQFIASIITMEAPRLHVQLFDQGEKLVTVAVVDPDIPNVEKDSFDSRCIYLAANIPVSHIPALVDLNQTSESQTILPWQPPYAHKGAPYHRIPILIFQQNNNAPIDVKAALEKVQREGFVMRSFASRHQLRPIGGHMFRTQWDEWMQKVMRLSGIPGAEIEYKFKRVEPLPKKRRDSIRMRGGRRF